MKILVPIKRVIDYNVRIRVLADGSGVETNGVKMSINPFDEIALEEAVQLREKGVATEVVVVSIGGAAVAETLRAGLALGADRAIHVQTDAEIQPLAAAKLLKAVVAQEQPQLVILGKQAIDDDASQTGQMLAALLGWGQGTFAYTLELSATHATVTREVDEGLRTVTLPLPCVVTTDLRLNQPRYPSLPNIMKAKTKPLAATSPEALGVAVEAGVRTLKVEEPARRQGGVRVASVEELVEKLRHEAKVV